MAKQQLLFGIIIGILVSLMVRFFVGISIGMGLLLLVGLFDVTFSPFKVSFSKNLKVKSKAFLKNRVYLGLTSLFFVMLLSGLYSEDSSLFMNRLRVKLPFLILPYAFYILPKIQKKTFYQILWVHLVLLSATAVYTLVVNLSDYQAMLDNLYHGKSLITPTNHIRYSLMIAIGIMGGLYLLFEKVYAATWQKWGIGLLTVFLLGFIHFLSVRSGLLALYAGLGVWGLIYMLKTKQYLIGSLAIVLLVSMPVIAYYTVDSFQMKISYMIRDLKNFREGFVYQYSDGQRLTSWKIGMEIGNNHPLIGVGLGDVTMEAEKIYERDYNNLEKRVAPHNQLIYWYAGAGFLGLIHFLWMFFNPLFYQKNYRNLFFASFHTIIFASFIPEVTLSTASGTALYIVWLLVGLSYLEGQFKEALSNS